MILEKILEDNPGIENNTERAADLSKQLGPAAISITLLEFAVRNISAPTAIKQFYGEYIQYYQTRFGLPLETAEVYANAAIGYAAVSYDPHRDAWFNNLPQISHPIFGRNRIKPEGKIITSLDVTLEDPELTIPLQKLLNQTDFFLTGKVSAIVSSDNSVTLTPSGHLGLSEKNLAILYATIDVMMDRITGRPCSVLDYNIDWHAADIPDSQSYWEQKLSYIQLENSWFKRGFEVAHTETKAWVEEAYIGHYPTPAMNGTTAPYGLHLTFNLSQPKGIGIKVGWTFLGSQVHDFLKESNVKRPEELIGKQLLIYERGMQIVGVQALHQS